MANSMQGPTNISIKMENAIKRAAAFASVFGSKLRKEVMEATQAFKTFIRHCVHLKVKDDILIALLNSARKFLSELDLSKARVLRPLKSRWLSTGECSSKYFFKCLKAKYLVDSITCLLDEHNVWLQDADQVGSLFLHYWQKVYSREGQSVDIKTRVESGCYLLSLPQFLRSKDLS